MRYSDWFTKALLERYGLDRDGAFFQEVLPQDIALRLNNLPAASLGANPERFIFFRSTLLQTLHVSWRDEIVNSIPQVLREIAKNAILPSEIEKPQLADTSKQNLSPESDEGAEIIHDAPIAEAGSHYPVIEDLELRKLTVEALLESSRLLDVEPIEALPESDFRWFLDAPYEMKIKVIDLVAVFDVTEEVRQIVDKKTLHLVLSLLSDSQQRYLKSLLHMPLKLTREPLELIAKLRQGVEKDTIRSYIHERGLARLSQILKEEAPLFTWYVLHSLDVKRAKWIEKKIGGGEGNALEKPQEMLRKADVRSAFQHAFQFINLEMSKMSGINRG